MFEILNKDKVTYGEYLKMSKKIFIDNFNNIFFLALVIFVPALLIESLFSNINLETEMAINYFLTEDMLEISEMEHYLKVIGGYLILSYLQIAFFGGVIGGTMANLTKSIINEEQVNKIGILKSVLKSLVNLSFARLIYILIVFITSIIGAVIPILIFIPLFSSIVMTFHIEEIVFNNKNGFTSLTSSIRLITNKKGRFFDVLVFYIFNGTISFLTSIILVMVASLFNIYGEIGSVFSSFIVYVFLLFFSIPKTLKYVNFKKIEQLNIISEDRVKKQALS